MIPYSSNTDVVEEYDPATNTWGGVKQRMPTPRSGGGYATYNGLIYIGGGEWISRDLMASFRALEAYEPATDTWTLLPALPGTVHGNAMAFIGNKLHNVSGKMENGGLPDPDERPERVEQASNRKPVSVHVRRKLARVSGLGRSRALSAHTARHRADELERAIAEVRS